ncbi:hypothetical protein RUM43_012542 [Polyplax serrata]|uniref:Uncharacterized protein n=1 Tax=Polyplax serrata TaxID=468196 RepID=A0AAN8P7X0_POLSC
MKAVAQHVFTSLDGHKMSSAVAPPKQKLFAKPSLTSLRLAAPQVIGSRQFNSSRQEWKTFFMSLEHVEHEARGAVGQEAGGELRGKAKTKIEKFSGGIKWFCGGSREGDRRDRSAKRRSERSSSDDLEVAWSTRRKS